MMKSTKLFFCNVLNIRPVTSIAAFFFFCILPVMLRAETLSQSDLTEIISKNSYLTKQQAQSLIGNLTQQLEATSDQPLSIQGVLHSSGFNGAFYIDQDEWIFDSSLRLPNQDQITKVPNVFSVQLDNSGLKVEYVYKWIFIFIPSDTSLELLDGAIFGQGLGLSLDYYLGGEAAILQGLNRSGNIYLMAISTGFSTGFTFPQLEFKQRAF